MRALLVLSAGPCQPGCSAQPSPASATAASAKTLTRGPNVCLISPFYRRLICAGKIFISVRRSSPICFFSTLGTKSSDKLREIAPPKCFSPTFTGFFETQWVSDSRKQTNFHSRRHTKLPYLLAGICHLGTNQQPSSLCFVFVNSWREEEDTLLMAVLMPLMCNSRR